MELYKFNQENTALRPGKNPSLERTIDNYPLLFTPEAAARINEANLCNFKGDPRALPPRKRNAMIKLQNENKCAKYDHWLSFSMVPEIVAPTTTLCQPNDRTKAKGKGPCSKGG